MTKKKAIRPIVNIHGESRLVEICAAPQPLEIDLNRTCLMIIDMQNAFASTGGMFHRWSGDISAEQAIITPIQQIVQAVRIKNVRIIYTIHQYSPDLHETGGPDQACWYKGREVYDYVKKPEWHEVMVASGTWGAEVIKELQPGDRDIMVVKSRYSAFFETNLDAILWELNIKYMIFVGLTTNGCVDSSIRDAYYRGYFPIVVSDATAAYPSSLQESVLYNIKLCLGWVTTTNGLIKSCSVPDAVANQVGTIKEKNSQTIDIHETRVTEGIRTVPS